MHAHMKMLSFRTLLVSPSDKSLPPKLKTLYALPLSPSCLPLTRLRTTPATVTDVAPREEEDDPSFLGLTTEATEPLPSGLRRESLPNHVAVIMDGNVRWARRRGLPPSSGHEAGVKSLRELIRLCCSWGIRVLTVFAFSIDNWIRPKVEVEFLMGLFERVIVSELQNFTREGIRVSVMGDPLNLPLSLQRAIADIEENTQENYKLQLIVAISYTGKHDILQACKSIAHKVKDGAIQLEEIDEKLIENELQTSCTEFPYPDLLIRTSGELRVSNFLLWQLAYTELFFVEAPWPDFGKAEFVESLFSFQKRQRRYGARDS